MNKYQGYFENDNMLICWIFNMTIKNFKYKLIKTSPNK